MWAHDLNHAYNGKRGKEYGVDSEWSRTAVHNIFFFFLSRAIRGPQVETLKFGCIILMRRYRKDKNRKRMNDMIHYTIIKY